MPPRKRKIVEELPIEETEIIIPKKPGIPKWAVTILLILLLLSASGFAWAFYSYRNVSNRISKQQSGIEDELQKKQEQGQRNKDFIERAGKLILLPTGEQPVIATITDIEKLKLEGNFYTNAKNGDIILVYPIAKKAFIYDPQNNIIVNVGPVVSEKVEPLSTPEATSTPSVQKINIEVRNATNVSGLATRLSQDLKKNASFNVVKVANSKSNFEQTILVDLGGDPELIKALEEELGTVAVNQIPTGEANSTARALIFVGADMENI